MRKGCSDSNNRSLQTLQSISEWSATAEDLIRLQVKIRAKTAIIYIAHSGVGPTLTFKNTAKACDDGKRKKNKERRRNRSEEEVSCPSSVTQSRCWGRACGVEATAASPCCRKKREAKGLTATAFLLGLN